MNFQTSPVFDPLRVLIFNALSPVSKLVAWKILSGKVFGERQFIDLTLVVYLNEIDTAELLKIEYEAAALSCINTIKVTSDLPRYHFVFHHNNSLFYNVEKLYTVHDGDVFCFITNLPNPNIYDYDEEEQTQDCFSSLYLMTKLANNFAWPLIKKEPDEDKTKIKNSSLRDECKRKPILVGDGIIAVDILKSLSDNMPPEILFYPTPLSAIAKAVVAEYLGVQCNLINKVLVWAANEEVFHIEIENPVLTDDVVTVSSSCDWSMIGKDYLGHLNLDQTQFNESWMKKEFLEKVAAHACKNPYGCVYKATEIARTMMDVWKTRMYSNELQSDVHSVNIGVMSDGSLGTIKGLPYSLPIIFKGDSWSVSQKYEENTHLKQEIKRINQTVKQQHDKLIPFCKMFLDAHVLDKTSEGSTESLGPGRPTSLSNIENYAKSKHFI